MSTLRIRDCYIITMDREDRLIPRGEVVLEGDKISYVGEVRENVEDNNFDQVIKASGKVCLPGFINTHTHSPMVLFRSFADDLPLMTWLEEKIWPLEDKLTSEDVYWSTLLAIIEMIKSGTTTFNDMYFFMDDMGKAIEESGIRAVLARGLIGLEDKGEVGLKETAEF
ncbi:MAG: N-ethylammeline chlorohydrolase, partial [Candidatus Syntrophonatronum acetioxidans]